MTLGYRLSHPARAAVICVTGLLLVILTACGGSARPTPAPSPAPPAATPDLPATNTATATAEATHTASPSPSVTPTAAPAPTATPLPHARLVTGRWLQSIGDCAAARREFAEVVTADPAPGETAEARYRLAMCYLRDDAYVEAAVVLALLLGTAPADDPYRGPAYFALGEALTVLGRHADAEANYLAFRKLVPELSSLAWQRIAAARRAADNLPGATEAYTAALTDSPDWQSTVTIRRALADVATARKDYRGAAAQYDLLRGEATTGAWAAEMYWLAGAALAKADAPAEAGRRWQTAVDAAPASTHAHQAIVALLDAGAAVDEYQRGLVNYYQGKYALAIAAFDRLRAADPAGRNGAAFYYAGISYLRLGNVAAALAELNQFIADYADSPLWPKAWLAQGEAQVAAKNSAAAIAIYRRLADQRPDAAEAPQALWRAAGLEAKPTTGSGRSPTEPLGAAAAYLALGRRYPATNEGWRAYQTVALAYFQAGNYGRAAEIWAEMAGVDLATGGTATSPPTTRLPDWTRAPVLYWLGRAQAAAGDAAAARRAWQMAAEADPDTFYGLRAADRLDGWGDPSRSPTAAAADAGAGARPAPTGETAALAAWLRTWAGDGTLALPLALLADPDWRRGEVLLLLERRTMGLAAWGRVQARFAADPWTLAAMAMAFRDAGANQLAALCGEQLLARWGGPQAEAAPAAQRLAYLFPYADLLQAEAVQRDLDPRLLAAVIRQESHFEWHVTSSAGAQGLMQIMPATADWLALQLRQSNFQPAQVFWPYVNIAFGAYYLRWGLDQFDGSVAATLAGYNGGPGNAATWLKQAGNDDDLMVAQIPFDETRLYVQTIWVQYETYKRLYP